MHRTAAVFAVVLLFPLAAFAHNTGASIERQVGNYVIDIGYDPQQPSAGEGVRFDFNLWNKDKTQNIPFTSVWVRFEDTEGLIFAGGLGRASFGLTGATLLPPRPGSYNLSVRFQNGDSTIAEGLVPISIEAGETGGGVATAYYWLVLAGLAGVVAGFAVGRRVRR